MSDFGLGCVLKRMAETKMSPAAVCWLRGRDEDVGKTNLQTFQALNERRSSTSVWALELGMRITEVPEPGLAYQTRCL